MQRTSRGLNLIKNMCAIQLVPPVNAMLQRVEAQTVKAAYSITCEYSRLQSPLRDAYTIQVEKFHTDEVNLPGIQALLLIGKVHLHSA